jgi:hypothetical protein
VRRTYARRPDLMGADAVRLCLHWQTARAALQTLLAGRGPPVSRAYLCVLAQPAFPGTVRRGRASRGRRVVQSSQALQQAMGRYSGVWSVCTVYLPPFRPRTELRWRTWRGISSSSGRAQTSHPVELVGAPCRGGGLQACICLERIFLQM